MTAEAPSSSPSAASEAATNPNLAHLRFDVRGMTCASCVRRVERALGGVDGVAHASVNLATEQATVDFDPALDVTTLRAAVDRAGYELRLPDAGVDEA